VTHDKRARRADVHHIKPAELVRKAAGAERSVAADIDTPEKDNERHDGS